MSQTVSVLNLKGKSVSKITLPKVFSTIYRPDIIRRAFLAAKSGSFQPKGVDPRAGKKTTATSRGTGMGLSRIPVTKGSRTHSAQRGALIPFAVGGYRTHPPRVEKKIVEKINKKERRLGIASAIGATANFDIVKSRGHKVQEGQTLPIIVSDNFQELTTTTDVLDVLEKLKLLDDLDRVKSGLKVRAGRGKTRGRKYRHPVGPLIVINEDLGISRAAKNLLGVSVASIQRLNAMDLAPGGDAGRLTVWTESAIKSLEKK